MSHALPLSVGVPALPAIGKINLAILAAVVVALSMRLWPEWAGNPDLSHGFFMPVVFLLLLHESRRGTQRYLPVNGATRLAFSAALAGALATLTFAGVYAAAVDWSHPLVDFLVTLSGALLFLAALLTYSSEAKRLVPFNWSAVVAIGLWMLAAPIPPGTYLRLTLQLQLWVSEGVLRTLHLLGVAAIRHGNVIDLANVTVGVEEACSGVRSLISCVFAGFLFSAMLVRRPWARGVLILLAAPIALVMNFLRSLTLTLMANRGIDISGTWHDATGFAVLGCTAAILAGLALLLERGARAEPPPGPRPVPGFLRRTGLDRALALGLAAALALIVFFVTHTRPSIERDQPAPDLFAMLPDSLEGWQIKSSDLYEFRGALQTDHLAQRHYVRPGESDALEIIIYVAYWRAGQAPVSLVSTHTPDACWPGAGWVALPTPEPRVNLITADRLLPAAEHRVFQDGVRPQHVWFWHLYNGLPIVDQDPYSPMKLLREALRHGFRKSGDQVFVRVSSNRPWKEIAHEPVLGKFFERIRPLGL